MANEKLMVCLRGPAYKGKSASIKTFADSLIKKPLEAEATWHLPMREEIGKLKKKIVKWLSDICVSVDVNGKRIGLLSAGDEPKVIKKYLPKLEKDKCKIIFCTSRTKASTTGVIKSIAKNNGYTLVWTAPYTDNTLPQEEPTQFQAALNSLKAKHLKEFIAINLQ